MGLDHSWPTEWTAAEKEKLPTNGKGVTGDDSDGDGDDNDGHDVDDGDEDDGDGTTAATIAETERRQPSLGALVSWFLP